MQRAGAERELAGRVALVTGAGVRVGRAIAEELACAGADVAVHYADSRAGAAAAVLAIKDCGVEGRAFQADLRRAAAPAALVRRVLAWRGRLDIVVNSAAVFDRRPFAATDDRVWNDTLGLNLLAPARLVRAAAQELARRRGVVINILDVAAFAAWRNAAAYAASKAALAMLTRCLALDLAPRVRVCGVAPGAVAFPAATTPGQRRRILRHVPLQRAGTPADVAQAVRYLASADYVTGAIIAVDGGRLAGSARLML